MAKAITAFEHIHSNNIKTGLLLMLFPVSLLVVFYVVCLFLFGSDYFLIPSMIISILFISLYRKKQIKKEAA